MKSINSKVLYQNINNIDALEVDYLYVKQSQIENAGKGLFTAIDIYKNESISIFKGEILSKQEAKRRALQKTDGYFINLLDGSIMDSIHTECFAKYANDAKGTVQSTYKNNAIITLDDDNNICLKATRAIKSGEEIFCSYGKSYWKKHTN